jgi:hypothetical protein
MIYIRTPVIFILLAFSLILNYCPSVWFDSSKSVSLASDDSITFSDIEVTIEDGDSRNFSSTPDIIAYANTNHIATPAEFSISTGGSIWRYHEWISLLDNTSWIEATTLVSTGSIGIQFWGDANDGWGRVLIDGSEIWTGNTNGTDGSYPGGAFVKYLVVSGLSATTHTIRVENMGIGGTTTSGDDVTILFFGADTSIAYDGTGECIGRYSFEGNAQDTSGYENNGTNNGATFSEGGVSGKAIRLDGIDDYIKIPININPEVMPKFTFSAWVKTTKIEGTVFSHDDGGYDRSIDIDNRGGGLGWSAFSGTGGVLGYHPVATNTWFFIAAVYDQDAGTVRLHVNDEIYQETGTLGTGWDYFHIGSNPSFGSFFSGMIDEVCVYNYALSPAQIEEKYKEIPGSTGSTESDTISGSALAAYYPFDNDLKDYSGNNNHGIQKGTINFATGYINSGAVFEGQSYIEVSDSPSLDLEDGFSFSTWIYRNDAGTRGWSVILSKGDTSSLGNDSPYALAHTQDGRYPLLRLTQNNSYSTLSSSKAVPFGEWYLLTVTWNGQKIDFYINGTYSDTQHWAGILPNSTASLLIGCDPPGATEYFKGTLDDLRIYNYPLSSSEIKALYDQGERTDSEETVITKSEASLKFESSSGRNGDKVKIPVVLADVQESIGNMDIILKYDSSILRATGVSKGALLSGASFDSNILGETIRLAFFDSRGIGNDGQVAELEFEVIGPEGDTAQLIIESVLANKTSDSSEINVKVENGVFRVIGGLKGDCDGDGSITVNDSLHILSAAVGKIATEPIMDVNNDGKVSSVDARMVLRAAIGMEELP